MMMKFGRKNDNARSRDSSRGTESMSAAIANCVKRGGNRYPIRQDANADQKHYVFMTR